METQFPQVIDLNVGGCYYTTMLPTLTKYPDSMLAAMFSGRHVVPQDKDGRYVIDCDGKIFRHILEFLRFGTLPPSEEAEAVHRYSLYYGLNELSKSMDDFQIVKRKIMITNMQQRRPEFIKLARGVIDCLTRNAVHKTTSTAVVIMQQAHPPPNMYINTPGQSFSHIFTNLPTPVRLRIDILISEIKFDDSTRNDELFFLTANYLENLGYAQNVQYALNPGGYHLHSNMSWHKETKVGCFLFCTDRYLSFCNYEDFTHYKGSPYFKREPSMRDRY